MSNITSYQDNGRFYYLNSQAANTSNASGATGATGATGMQDASGASGASGIGSVTVEKLTFNEAKELFLSGNLTKEEMDKWLASNKDVKGYNFTENNDMLTYTINYKGKVYKISCAKVAAESQTDKKTQQTFAANYLKSIGFTDDMINKYFVMVDAVPYHSITGKSYGIQPKYVLKPDSGFSSIEDLKAEVFRDKYENNLKQKIQELAKKFDKCETLKDRAKNGEDVSKEFEKLLNSINLNYSTISNYAQKYKLNDTETKKQFDVSFQNFIDNTRRDLLDLVINDDISVETSQKLFSKLNRYNNKSKSDMLKEFIEKASNPNALEFTEDTIYKGLSSMFPDWAEKSDAAIKELSKEIYGSIQSGSTVDTEHKAAKIEATKQIYDEKNKLLDKINYYKTNIKRSVSMNDFRTLPDLINNLKALNSEISAFCKNVKDAYGSENMIKELQEALRSLFDAAKEANKTEATDAIETAIEEAENTLASLAYNDWSDILDNIFSDKDVVSIQDLLRIISDYVISSNDKNQKHLDWDKFKNDHSGDKDIQKAIEKIENDLVQEGIDPSSLTAEELKIRLAEYLDELKGTINTGEKPDGETISLQAVLDDLSDDREIGYQGATESFSAKFGDLKISASQLKARLQEIFAGREDIARSELQAALDAIYTAEYYSQTNAAVETTQDTLKYGTTQVGDMQSAICATIFDNFQIFADAGINLPEFFSDVLSDLSDLAKALESLDLEKANEIILKIQEKMQKLQEIIDKANNSEGVSSSSTESNSSSTIYNPHEPDGDEKQGKGSGNGTANQGNLPDPDPNIQTVNNTLCELKDMLSQMQMKL